MTALASDGGRDTIARFLGDLFGVIGVWALVVIAVVAVVVALLGGLRSLFPKKKHRWCDGRGHWGIGPFRRTCGACSGSGLVDR